MTTIASRDLRNHTRDVLRAVAEGDSVTITVNGKPVALLSRPASQAPTHLRREDLARLHSRQRLDPTLAADLTWISSDTTDDLGPVG
jgi:antitoxin (DNA-binding transcriptional repressor) of toxin-antitoxin stability system